MSRPRLLGEIPKYFLEIVFIVGVGLLAVGAAAGNTSGDSLTLLAIFVAAGTRILPSAVRLINAVAGIRFARAPLAHLVAENRMQEDARREEQAARVTDEVPAGRCARPRPDLRLRRPARRAGAARRRPRHPERSHHRDGGFQRCRQVDVRRHPARACTGPRPARSPRVALSIFDNLPAWQRRAGGRPPGRDAARRDPRRQHRLRRGARRRTAWPRRSSAPSSATSSARLPDGLDTEIGERGVRLSGGQRQRIGIARALYRRPALLVLDEATSALDNETERRLTETIEGLKGSMTIVIVAHRLSTVRHCDQLVFMAQGRVETVGTFDEVQSGQRRVRPPRRAGGADRTSVTQIWRGQPSPGAPVKAARSTEKLIRSSRTSRSACQRRFIVDLVIDDASCRRGQSRSRLVRSAA